MIKHSAKKASTMLNLLLAAGEGGGFIPEQTVIEC